MLVSKLELAWIFHACRIKYKHNKIKTIIPKIKIGTNNLGNVPKYLFKSYAALIESPDAEANMMRSKAFIALVPLNMLNFD